MDKLEKRMLTVCFHMMAEQLAWTRARERAIDDFDPTYIEDEALRLMADCLPPDQNFDPVDGSEGSEVPQF